MRTDRTTLEDVAELGNLTHAFWAASLGKRARPEVLRFGANLDRELSRLRAEILAGSIDWGASTTFWIHDPKRRRIVAPVFRLRVAHHALMRHVGPILDRGLVADSFACRSGKGAHAAVRRAWSHHRRAPWCCQIDVRGYFASIPHDRLLGMLRRRFRDRGLRRLFVALLQAQSVTPGCGVPIGTLTSQHFGNAYLGPLDRLLLEQWKVRRFVRYMDDLVWWPKDRALARESLQSAEEFARDELGLKLHEPRMQRTHVPLLFLGVRIDRAGLRPGRRRRRRQAIARQHWERAYADGWIDAAQLQRAYDAVRAVTAGTADQTARAADLRRRPAVDA